MPRSPQPVMAVTRHRLIPWKLSGDTFVVIVRTKEKGKAQNSTEFTAEYRWTDVFVKKNGRWQCVAAQVARVTPPRPKQ